MKAAAAMDEMVNSSQGGYRSQYNVYTTPPGGYTVTPGIVPPASMPPPMYMQPPFHMPVASVMQPPMYMTQGITTTAMDNSYQGYNMNTNNASNPTLDHMNNMLQFGFSQQVQQQQQQQQQQQHQQSQTHQQQQQQQQQTSRRSGSSGGGGSGGSSSSSSGCSGGMSSSARGWQPHVQRNTFNGHDNRVFFRDTSNLYQNDMVPGNSASGMNSNISSPSSTSHVSVSQANIVRIDEWNSEMAMGQGGVRPKLPMRGGRGSSGGGGGGARRGTGRSRDFGGDAMDDKKFEQDSRRTEGVRGRNRRRDNGRYGGEPMVGRFSMADHSQEMQQGRAAILAEAAAFMGGLRLDSRESKQGSQEEGKENDKSSKNEQNTRSRHGNEAQSDERDSRFRNGHREEKQGKDWKNRQNQMEEKRNNFDGLEGQENRRSDPRNKPHDRRNERGRGDGTRGRGRGRGDRRNNQHGRGPVREEDMVQLSIREDYSKNYRGRHRPGRGGGGGGGPLLGIGGGGIGVPPPGIGGPPPGIGGPPPGIGGRSPGIGGPPPGMGVPPPGMGVPPPGMGVPPPGMGLPPPGIGGPPPGIGGPLPGIGGPPPGIGGPPPGMGGPPPGIGLGQDIRISPQRKPMATSIGGIPQTKETHETEEQTNIDNPASTVPLEKEDSNTQRERLIEQLNKGVYECMVCCDRIKQLHAIWSCENCFNCFHLGCIKKWAKSSQGDQGWRCPACQNSTVKVPNGYKCFCGKLREPDWNRRDTAHSCGEVCGKGRAIEWCHHKCNILCHPGPCPPCSAYIKRSCPCGAETRDVKCCQTEPFKCNGVCGKKLNCFQHSCEKICHTGECGVCTQIVLQSCYCSKEKREVPCGPETFGVDRFTCEGVCGRKLDCGNHECQEPCHAGECKPCEKAVEKVSRCPCGKTPLEKLYERDGVSVRKSCTDPIPTCAQTCQRTLKCGLPGSYHECAELCHEGPCPPCTQVTPVKCRCGFMDKNVPCAELSVKADEVTCEKQCKKMRQCGRHKCAMKCCIDVDHICMLVCGRTLTCGLHKCQEACHRGNCPRCWQTSFDELTCHCGNAVLYPPIPCGTKPPACDQQCQRPQPCGHPVFHTCHPLDNCPPCTTLVDKPCFGGHKDMKSTPCYLPALSCGEICSKPLPCGLHQCQRVCHEGSCVSERGSCPQKCLKVRQSCGHACNNQCHQGDCPDTPCKELVQISCICGHRKVTLQCSENDREYKVLATSLLASQMQHMNNGYSVDLSDIFTATARPDKLKRLECNDNCKTMERNRRLALALQIENPEAREKLGSPSLIFSDFMKEEARKDIKFALLVHDTLTELVLKAKESKQKSRSHSFAPMNRDKRQFVHEYCEHFGCQSQSYDEEPKKNVVATAIKGMCFLPPISIVALVQREQGQIKAVLGRKAVGSECGQGMKKLEKAGSQERDADQQQQQIQQQIQQQQLQQQSTKQPIDYFDFDPSSQ